MLLFLEGTIEEAISQRPRTPSAKSKKSWSSCTQSSVAWTSSHKIPPGLRSRPVTPMSRKPATPYRDPLKTSTKGRDKKFWDATTCRPATDRRDLRVVLVGKIWGQSRAADHWSTSHWLLHTLSHQPLVTQEPLEFPSCSWASSKDQAGLDTMLSKGWVEIISGKNPLFYTRLFLMEKMSGRWRSVIVHHL